MSDDLFVLGVLSRGRPECVRRCVTSALATAGEPLLVVVAFDDDTIGFDAMPAYTDTVKVLLRPRHYYCAGMNELYAQMQLQAAMRGASLDYFAVVNDDVEFLSAQWPEQMRGFLAAHFPDGEGIAEMVAPDKCAHYVTRAGFINREFGGRLAAPGYVMYYSDGEMMRQAKALGRYGCAWDAKANTPVVVHHEIWDGLRHEMRMWYARDRDLYESRFPRES